MQFQVFYVNPFLMLQAHRNNDLYSYGHAPPKHKPEQNTRDLVPKFACIFYLFQTYGHAPTSCKPEQSMCDLVPNFATIFLFVSTWSIFLPVIAHNYTILF